MLPSAHWTGGRAVTVLASGEPDHFGGKGFGSRLNISSFSPEAVETAVGARAKDARVQFLLKNNE